MKKEQLQNSFCIAYESCGVSNLKEVNPDVIKQRFNSVFKEYKQNLDIYQNIYQINYKANKVEKAGCLAYAMIKYPIINRNDYEDKLLAFETAITAFGISMSKQMKRTLGRNFTNFVILVDKDDSDFMDYIDYFSKTIKNSTSNKKKIKQKGKSEGGNKYE